MENVSKYDWVLIGTKSVNENEKLSEDQIQKMLKEAFLPEREFQLFLCGAIIDKYGTLETMETGLDLIKEKMNNYREGDYCIISSHDEGSLLFFPITKQDDML